MQVQYGNTACMDVVNKCKRIEHLHLHYNRQTKNSIIAYATAEASFSIGICPAFGILTSLEYGICETKYSAFSTCWNVSSSPHISNFGVCETRN